MIDERRQFRILNRDFLSRMIDLELIAAGGDPRALITRFGAMLAALSFCLTYLMVTRYLTSTLPHARLAVLARTDEEFLISATITIAGLCAVMAWNTVFPDRRDSLILGLIPIRPRTMIAARVAAIAAVIGGVVLALNICTGLAFPLSLSTGIFDALGSLVTWWFVIALASLTTFCFAVALQGITAQLLPWRGYLRVSGILQLALLFVVLALFFVTPPFDPVNAPVIFPSFWFVGLLHVVRGDSVDLFLPLAMRALTAMAIVIPLAALVYVLFWSRNLRRMIEAPEILPAKNPRIVNWIARRIAPGPFERAILQFTSRTLARSRQHRMMLALYGGFAFALALAFSHSFLEGTSHVPWNEPNEAFVIGGLLLISCAVVGVRALFAVPFMLPANWIFRITSVHRPSAYFAAVRKSLFTIAAAPVWVGAVILYLSIWPGRPAIEHVLILVLVGIILVERGLNQFRKIPFACSWLPGATHRKMKIGIWGWVFLLVANILAGIEVWALGKPARIYTVLGILAALALYSRRRTLEFANAPENRVQFEDSPPGEIFALDLHQDGAWLSDEAFVDTIDPNMGRSIWGRLRPFALGFAALIACGFLYEQASEWHDHREFPRIGQAVDIGGRSLNLYCTGQGSPAVIFDSGGNQPGYSWLLVQPKVARFTRACWYDRAGYGWSDTVSGSRTSAEIAADLHKLLHAARIPPPYVLVGHSFGGFNIRLFAARYRKETAGLVLADSADEFENPDFLPAVLQSPVQRLLPREYWGAVAAGAEFLVHLGVMRLLDNGAGPTVKPLTARDVALFHALALQAKTFDATTSEGLDHENSAAQVRAVRDLGSLPLVVLTGGRFVPGRQDDPQALMLAAYMKQRIYGTQAALAKLSSRGEQRILPFSGHAIPFDDPQSIVDAVQDVVGAARRY
ncbi:MAG TPA: alpha/beta hydrolase [Bryobacteraceae bacterium]|nr:alpha/beta hydrolase [Bryobacteraceae bacterium]